MNSCYDAAGVATISCIPCFIKWAINFGLVLGATIAVFFVVFSGIKFIVSKGDPLMVGKAKQTLTFAVVGLVIIILSFAIINFVGSTFKIAFFDLCPAS